LPVTIQAIDLTTFTTESQSRAGVKGKISDRAQKAFWRGFCAVDNPQRR
jgi:hypothetical protein